MGLCPWWKRDEAPDAWLRGASNRSIIMALGRMCQDCGLGALGATPKDKVFPLRRACGTALATHHFILQLWQDEQQRVMRFQ